MEGDGVEKLRGTHRGHMRALSMRRSLAVCVDAFHHTHRTFWNGRTRRSQSITFYISCIPEHL